MSTNRTEFSVTRTDAAGVVHVDIVRASHWGGTRAAESHAKRLASAALTTAHTGVAVYRRRNAYAEGVRVAL